MARAPSHESLSYMIQGHDALGGGQPDGFLRHSEYHAARFVLRNRGGIGLPHLEQAAGAVIAHCGA